MSTSNCGRGGDSSSRPSSPSSRAVPSQHQSRIDVHVDALGELRRFANEREPGERPRAESRAARARAPAAHRASSSVFAADARAGAAAAAGARSRGRCDASRDRADSSTARARRRAYATSRARAALDENGPYAPDELARARSPRRGRSRARPSSGSVSTPASALRRSARLCAGSSAFTSARLAQQRAQLARGLLELDAADLLPTGAGRSRCASRRRNARRRARAGCMLLPM